MLVCAMHITAGVWINDDEPGILEDTLEWLDKLAPPIVEGAGQRGRARARPRPRRLPPPPRQRRGQRGRALEEPARPSPGDRPGDGRQARPRPVAGRSSTPSSTAAATSGSSSRCSANRRLLRDLHGHLHLLVQRAHELVRARHGQLALERVVRRGRLGVELLHALGARLQLDVVDVAALVEPGPAPRDLRAASSPSACAACSSCRRG